MDERNAGAAEGSGRTAGGGQAWPEAPMDDEALGAVVRDVAEGWRMPPQRLGQRTWRDRVAERDRRMRRPWSRWLIVPAAVAVVATVVLAVGVAWLDGQGRLPATGAVSPTPSTNGSPGGSPTPSASEAPAKTPRPSPAPALVIHGDPLPIRAMVLQAGGHRVLDLRTGALGASMERDPYGSSLFLASPDDSGAWSCVCIAYDRPPSQDPTGLSVERVDFDAAGAEVRRRSIGTYDGGRPDADVRLFGQVVDVQISRSMRPGIVYLGWTVRGADGWQSGVDVVDLAAAKVIQKVHLPALPSTDGSDDRGPRGTFAQAPLVTESPDATAIVIRQLRAAMGRDATGAYSDLLWTTPDHWSASVTWSRAGAGDVVGALTDFATGEGTLDPTWCPNPYGEAFAGPSSYTALCASPGVVRRVDLAGRPLGDVRVEGLDRDTFATSLVGPDGVRFLWMPFERRVVRVEPDGQVTQATIEAPTAALPDDPLALLGALGRGLGRWIVPVATAKIYLDPALALSPDGSRLYVLGTRADSFVPVEGTTDGSAGIHVLDAHTLDIRATWPATADFTSIAVSRDGTLVYALGAPGVRQLPDGSAVQDDTVEGSLTVFDAVTGQVRAVAGRVGSDFSRLEPALVP